jgi:hypothetical protein
VSDIRILVTGGRNYTDRTAVARALRHLAEHYVFGAKPEEFVLVHGDCKRFKEDGSFDPDRSADQLAEQEARKLGWRAEPHEVKREDYDRHGKRAPILRNQRMVILGASYCIAFPGGSGTAHCRRAALAARIPVIDVPEGGDRG